MKASSVLDRKRAAYRLLSEVMDGAPESLEALEESMAALASHAKLVFGCCNNCAAIMLFDGHDVAKQLPQYRQGVKKAFKAALQEFKEYEQRLLYASNMRMFHVDDMPASVRKSYGAVSDRQFFEFWQGIGSSTYEKARPFIGSLQNKYRLSMEKHDMRDASRSAALITTLAGIRLTEQIFDIFVEEAAKGNKLPPEFVRLVFGRLSMKRIGDAWENACRMLKIIPEYDLDESETKNIQFGLDALCDIMSDTDGVIDSLKVAVDDYRELFRTEGERKKALRNISEAAAEMREGCLMRNA